jgi:hypothetical protein
MVLKAVTTPSRALDLEALKWRSAQPAGAPKPTAARFASR